MTPQTLTIFAAICAICAASAMWQAFYLSLQLKAAHEWNQRVVGWWAQADAELEAIHDTRSAASKQGARTKRALIRQTTEQLRREHNGGGPIET